MESPSILISSAYYPPHLGGVEVFTRSIARELASRGVAVTVVTSGVGDDAAHDGLDDGVEVLRAPAADPIGRYPVLSRMPSAGAFWAQLENRWFDAIVVNTRFYDLSLRVLKMARRKGIRPVLIEHGSDYLTFGNSVLDVPVRLYENTTAAAVRRADPACYGVSSAACSWLEHFCLHPQGTIHNSIDAAAFRSQASSRDFRAEEGIALDERMIAFSGRLIAEKGIWTLVEAARMLEGDSVRFLIAGDGPELDELRRRRPSNMSVLGRLSRKDMAALLMASDIFCFPSEYPEGMPTSLLEAAVCEAYIVGTPVGGMSEIVPDSAHGTVLKSADATECADALRAALSDEPGLRAGARRCRELVEREFSWQKAADDLLAACGAALQAR